MSKKSFFASPSKGQIKQYDLVSEFSENFIDNIVKLEDEQYGILNANLIPKVKLPDGRVVEQTARKWLKHASSVEMPKPSTLEEAIELGMPWEQREQVFADLNPKTYNGIVWKPFSGDDRRTRRVKLVEIMEGLKLDAHAHRPDDIGGFKARIDVIPYADAKRVSFEGADVQVIVPSRRQKALRYVMMFSSVPVVDNENKFAIGYGISSEHSCDKKKFNIRYLWENSIDNSRIIDFCAHEVAGYLNIIDYYKNVEDNLVPLQMSFFPLPKPELMNFYEKLDNNLLVQRAADATPEKLNQAEKEILLWGFVHKAMQNNPNNLPIKDINPLFAQAELRNYSWRNG